ncbi:hypothetical protein [Thiomonas sp.]|nr:hypothetical protein [Thiomonas sp.]
MPYRQRGGNTLCLCRQERDSLQLSIPLADLFAGVEPPFTT